MTAAYIFDGGEMNVTNDSSKLTLRHEAVLSE